MMYRRNSMSPREENDMAAIRIYESALCCDTGVCGADVDQGLIDITATVRSLQDRGLDIQRHNLASDPLAFTTEPAVQSFMTLVGSTGLPLTVVNGVTVATGSYPNRQQLLAFSAIDLGAPAPTSPAVPTGRTQLGLTDKNLTDKNSVEKKAVEKKASDSNSSDSNSADACCGGGCCS
jgi:hypothetical protein